MKESKTGEPLLYCASCRDYQAIARAVGQPPVHREPVRLREIQTQQQRMKEVALRLWHASEPAWQTLTMGYLMSRGFNPELSRLPELRFMFDCPHPEGGRLPAMIALVRDANGEPCAIHRTYLKLDGSGKADIEPQKATLGPYWGGAIRLAPMAAEMVIGEGIETSIAAAVLTKLPPWAAIAAGNLATGMILPVGIRSVVIAVDRDPAGERAANSAAARWRAEGRHVRLLIPDTPGTDAADLMRMQAAGNA